MLRTIDLSDCVWVFISFNFESVDVKMPLHVCGKC